MPQPKVDDNVDNKISHPQEGFLGSTQELPSHPEASVASTEAKSAQNPQPQPMLHTQPHNMLQMSAQPQPQVLQPPTLPLNPPLPGQQQFIQPTAKPTNKRGLIPNICRKAIPLEDLREHPNFHELPHPSEVKIGCLQHLSLYRKDSWQYTNLIKGRLNCSQLASLLGFYEKKYARLLHVPEGRIGHKHAKDVWEALREKAISDFQQLQRIAKNQRFKRQSTKWKKTKRGVWMFDYEPHNKAASKQYRDLTSGRQHNANHPTIQWQRAHDPVGLLAAVNMFGKLGAKIKEVGILPMEAVGIPMHFHVVKNRLNVGLLSASPQAIIEWYNGTIEVLSVVSMCPFERVLPESSSQKVEYMVVDRPPESTIPPWMYPQIQFQIYCAGIKTTSAIVIFYSPTGGMNLFRVQKNQVYVDHMLTYVHLFKKQFAQSPPPDNFFQDLQCYEQFCVWTAELATKIPMLSHIQPELVQSSPIDHPSNTSWFLENVPNPYFTPNRNQTRDQNNSGNRGSRGRNFRNNNNQRFGRRNRRNNNHNNHNNQLSSFSPSQVQQQSNYPPSTYPPNIHNFQQPIENRGQQPRGRRVRKKSMQSNSNHPNQQNYGEVTQMGEQPMQQQPVAHPQLTQLSVVGQQEEQVADPGPGWVQAPVAPGEAQELPKPTATQPGDVEPLGVPQTE